MTGQNLNYGLQLKPELSHRLQLRQLKLKARALFEIFYQNKADEICKYFILSSADILKSAIQVKFFQS